MDRRIVYPGAIPLDLDLLQPQVNAMVALGALIRATLGTGTMADGFAISQNTVPDLNVVIGPGSLVSLSSVDAAAFGSVASNGAALMKQGIRLTSTTLACAAPATSGHSINYLIQAAFSETDGAPVVLPYYNAANPSIPYTGPAGAGTPNNTARTQSVTLQAKAGVSAATGSQTTPAADSGFVGLYVVTVANGQTEITNGSLANALLPSAPFISVKLSDLQAVPAPVSHGAAGSYNYVVPPRVTRVRVRAWGGGGGGGGNTTSGGGGGGGGGGYTEGIVTVTPGETVVVTVGGGGAGGVNNGGSAAANTGGNGGTSSFGAFLSAAGGAGGQGSLSGGQGDSGLGGIGASGTINIRGGNGNAGFASGSGFGGRGGAAGAGGGGGGSSTGLPTAGGFPGGGGGGGGGNFAGAAGAAGLVVIEPIGRA